MKFRILIPALALVGCAPEEPAPTGLFLGPEVTCGTPVDDPDLPGFVDVTAQSGIARVPSMPEWTQGSNGVTSIQLEAAGGFIVADLDGDDLLDLVFTEFSGAPRFYFGLGDLQFVEVPAAQLGVDLRNAHANGGSAADVDGDGDLDLWFGTYLEHFLFLNDGVGSFEDVTSELGLRGLGNQLTGSWADPDRDGDLDLYVAAHSPGSLGPGEPFENDGDYFWLQEDDGTFVDATPRLYQGAAAGQGFVGGWFDADGDGWQDLYVVNDGGAQGFGGPPNRYFANQGGVLTDAPNAGADIGMLAMGLALGDMDNDGDLDVHVTDAGPTLLLRNEGAHQFTDISLCVESFSDGSSGDISWGTIFFDHDNDGVLELHTSFGHMPTKAGGGPNWTQNREVMPDQLWRRDGEEWIDIAPAAGVADPAWSRTAQAVDLDGDGFAELLSWSLDEGPRLYQSGCNERAWLDVRLRDSTSKNSFAIGARITATGDGTPLVMREIGAGNTGTMSGGPPTARLGLNEAEAVDLEVRWPDGVTEHYPDVLTRRQVTISR